MPPFYYTNLSKKFIWFGFSFTLRGFFLAGFKTESQLFVSNSFNTGFSSIEDSLGRGFISLGIDEISFGFCILLATGSAWLSVIFFFIFLAADDKSNFTPEKISLSNFAPFNLITPFLSVSVYMVTWGCNFLSWNLSAIKSLVSL